MLKKMSCFISVMFMLLPVAASALELDEFDLLGTRRHLSDIDFLFSMNSGNQPQASYNGALSGGYQMIYSTLPLYWTLDFDGQIGFSRDRDEDAEADENYNFLVQTTADKYFSGVDVGSFLGMNEFLGFGSLDLGLRKSKGADDADDPYAKIGIGVGLGRLVDATDLAKAMRLTDDLIKHGIASRSLSKEAFFDLAKIISRESQYKKDYGSEVYERYWFDDIEKILRQDGVLTSSTLGSLGNLRTQEVLVNIPLSNVRSHGRIARFGIGYIVSDYVVEDTDPTVDLSYQFALPRKTYKFQLDNLSGYSLKFGDNMTHTFTNTLTAISSLSLRTDWENIWTLQYFMPDGDNTLTNNLTSILRYYITSKIDLSGRLAFSHVADGQDDNGNDDLGIAFNLGIGYTFR